MFCNINYKIDKKYFKDLFWKNQQKNMKYWMRKDENWVWLKDHDFHIDKMCLPILKDLNIYQFKPVCGFRYLFKNKKIKEHLDINRIITILFNLQDENYPKPIIHICGKPYEYEAALIDVGTKVHSVESVNYPRLNLKFNFSYGDWKTLYNILDKKGVIDHN
jgi:hypothetical protein